MIVRTVYVLNAEEVLQLGYRLICESMGGSLWKTGRVQRAYKETFNKQEQQDIKCTIYRKAYVWYLKTGTPEQTEMSEYEYNLWHKLRKFCVEHCTTYGGRQNGRS